MNVRCEEHQVVPPVGNRAPDQTMSQESRIEMSSIPGTKRNHGRPQCESTEYTSALFGQGPMKSLPVTVGPISQGYEQHRDSIIHGAWRSVEVLEWHCI